MDCNFKHARAVAGLNNNWIIRFFRQDRDPVDFCFDLVQFFFDIFTAQERHGDTATPFADGSGNAVDPINARKLILNRTNNAVLNFKRR